MAYFLLHQWREKIRTSTPLHFVTLFGIDFILHPFAASRTVLNGDEDEADVIAKNAGNFRGNWIYDGDAHGPGGGANIAHMANSGTSHFFSSRCCRPSAPPQAPPSPKKVPFTVSIHGRTWQDRYHRMSNTDDPHLLDHLNRENSAFMADTLKLRSDFSSEMKARLPPTISTPPERWEPWLYYQYIPEGKEYPVLCRKLGNGEKWLAEGFFASQWNNKIRMRGG